MLLHGWGMHGGVWKVVSESLAARFRVHLVDLPGHGLSPSCNEDWVDLLAETFPHEVFVCGWSLGGQLAMEWAWKYPERIPALALISCTPSFVERKDWMRGIGIKVFEAFRSGLEKDVEATLKRFLFLQAQGGKDEKTLLRTLQHELKEADKEGLEKGLELLGTIDLREKARTLAQPVLLIHGGEDRLIPLNAAKWLSENMQHAQLEVIPDCAHAPIISHPDFCISRLLEFLHGLSD